MTLLSRALLRRRTDRYSHESIERSIRVTSILAKTFFTGGALAMLALVIYAGVHMRQVAADFDALHARAVAYSTAVSEKR